MALPSSTPPWFPRRGRPLTRPLELMYSIPAASLAAVIPPASPLIAPARILRFAAELRRALAAASAGETYAIP